MNNPRSKKILIIFAIAFIGLSLVGSTYAYLTMSLNVNNGTYNNVTTHCFGVTYNAQNIDGSTDITGTLFPSGTSKKGLTGRVGFSSDPTCSLTGLGTINLNIANGTSSTLTTPASSYCESRSTLEPIPEYTTEAACTTAGERWRGYGDSYCENPNTLERLEDYTSQSDCTSNGGNWTSGGSPLKYAVYTSTDTNATPVSVGRINTSDIGNTVTIYNNFAVINTMSYYYIYIWLDGYLTDNTYTNLPFSATISASVSQNPNAAPLGPNYIYTVNLQDDTVTDWNSVWQGQPISNNITTYNSPSGAITALETAYSNANSGATASLPFFLKHTIGDGTLWCANQYNNGVATGNSFCAFPSQSTCNSRISGWIEDDITYTCVENTFTGGVTESYVGFIVTPTMAANNAGMTAGTYYLKGGDNGIAYNDNKATLLSAFGSSDCTDYSSFFYCHVSGLYADAYSDGSVHAGDGAGSYCSVCYGDSYCGV